MKDEREATGGELRAARHPIPDPAGEALNARLLGIVIGLIGGVADARERAERAALSAERAEARRAAIEDSTAWRLTAPLRRAIAALGDAAGRLRGRLTPLRGTKPTVAAEDPDPSPSADAAATLKQQCRDRYSRLLDDFLATDARLRLPAAAAPRVSVILVLFNQAELTFACLSALAQKAGRGAEFIILDNGSSDRTDQLLDRIDGATVLRMEENLHFLRGVNRAAKEASGPYLLLLNNDTEVAPGAIDAAAARLDAEPDLGAVGGPILRLDGTLQEAGAIIWRDGHTEGYGRGADPEAWEFGFRRDVDYCSGAFLMVRRDLFEALGGLDQAYAPAYFEETDLCMRIRQAGFRVGYEPAARIMHFEYGSASSGGEAPTLYTRNHRLFVERHRETLERSHLPPEAGALRARMRRAAPGAALVLDARRAGPMAGSGPGLAERLDGGGVFVTEARFPNPAGEAAGGLRRPASWIEQADLSSPDKVAAFVAQRRGYYDVVIALGDGDEPLLDTALAAIRAADATVALVDLRRPGDEARDGGHRRLP